VSTGLRILGIDPSLRSTGFAVIEVDVRGYRALAAGTIKNPPGLAASRCLTAIHDQLDTVIREHRPTQAALEAIIFAQNMKTAIIMGHARGAAVLACARHGLEIFEYSPKKVKMGVHGKCSAAKQQVSFMIRAMLGLRENPPFDVADAFAVALTHAQQKLQLNPRRAI
jgi:crossover junction endodeoxyribonuclease RuvC